MSRSPDRQRLPDLFAEADALEPGARRRFVEALAVAEPELASELAELLEAAPGSRERFATPAFERLETDRGEALAAVDSPPPERLGPYRILRELGRGGMGRVFLAEEVREAYRRRLALKVVDRPWASPERLRRFREEVRILASLEHPGIARFLDGGQLADGTSYLALEYVEGSDLMAHCAARTLDIEARLRLFVEVLDAVAFAHGRGVVHRDLKPSNILVDRAGRPRLLDFGVAKLLEEGAETDSAPTRTEFRAFTPAYASPEQFLGGAISPASDVYSAGVVLYELLTGGRPHDDAGSDRRSIERAVLSREASPPSRRRRTITSTTTRPTVSGEAREAAGSRRDLDAIVLRALRREPADRYPSARELADDLGRYLDRRPVAARRGGRLYRARTFLRRHRATLAVGAAAALFAAAVALVAPRLEIRRTSAPPPLPAARGPLPEIGELSARFATNPGELALGLDLVRAQLARGRGEEAIATVARLRQIPAQPALAPRVDLAEAEAALAVSEFQRAAHAADRALIGARSAGDARLALDARLAQALAQLRLAPPEASEERLAALFADAEREGAPEVAARALLARAQAARRGARAEEASALLSQALERAQALDDRALRSEALILRARLEGEAGEFEAALASVEAALADARAIGHLGREGAALATRATLLNWKGEDRESERTIVEATQKLRMAGDRELLMLTLTNLSLSRIDESEFAEAGALIQEAEEIARALGSPLPRASTLRARGYLEESRGSYDAARASYEGAVLAAREAGADETLATYLSDLAWLEYNVERAPEAARAAREASEIFRRGGDERAAAQSDCVLAWSEASAGERAAGERRLAEIERQAEAMDSDALRYSTLLIRASLAELAGDWREAAALRRRSVAMAAEFTSPGLVLSQRAQLAKAMARAGESDAALALARELLPEAERLGRGDVVRDCRELLAGG